MPSQQPLASKEASLFRNVLKFYETKQYKKGLKAVEQARPLILRKSPKHGETLAMKGLLINCQGKTDEAFAIAKDALKQDMKSHVCWHVYGLLYRSQKNFDEAIKAYKMALRFEPESQQILRDLALLQVQMRDYTGYIESRRLMVIAKPQIRQNWTGLAIAYHLSGNLVEAENVLTKYEDTLKQPPPRTDLENSEAILYKNTVIAETGNYEKALDHLDLIAKTALDKVSILEARAEYNLKLGNMEPAEKAYRVLLDRNQEKRDYYAGLEKSLGVEGEERLKIYEELAAQYPRADAPKRIPLDFLEGDAFKAAAQKYLDWRLPRAAPSTFTSLKALYSDVPKRECLQQQVEDFLAKHREENPVEEAAKEGDKLTNGANNANSVLIYTLYYLSQHYDHWRIRDTDKALSYINEALELAPDNADQGELRLGLARILKHAGDTRKAMEEMDNARQKDKSDRYYNTKCSKYMLRNDCNDEAIKTMGLFTRNDVNGPLGDLLEMQCVWYITEDGESYTRQGKLGLALKRFHAVYKIFEDWTDDQFDFHSFSLRKGMIRAYVDMVRWEDALWAHPFFRRAAVNAIRLYLLLNEKPHLAHGSLANGAGADAVDFESLSTADRKKAMKKAKREAQRQEKAAVEAAAKAKDERRGGEEKRQDDDPLGAKLAQTAEPLEKALMWVKPLLEFSPRFLDGQTAGFDVYMKRGKYLLALKCLLAAHDIAPEDPVVHEQIVKFQLFLDSKPELSPIVQSIIDDTFTLGPKDGVSLAEFNESYLQSQGSRSARAVFAVVKTRQVLAAAGKSGDGAETDSEALLVGALELEGATLKEAVEGLAVVRELKGDVAAYTTAGRARWPLANVFEEKA
ncbi:hypothetical protein DRE_02184 [Drechslerella stenobrocha 248]|uniref:N-alpha-acetyltransferase 16, NatA auxiliary subunit n=1 Tax=Drechslerella stenobrocha 248 TaxID=1043628 RepID=W7IGR7_9PEZI|nr:hypothetical protein DRE_02184 [Drechslerella stenobrocha 248]